LVFGEPNVDHFISLLNGDDLTPDKRTAITTLLITELDKLANEPQRIGANGTAPPHKLDC
jgi:hypothetical protein